ncbi:MAG: hypothetical protein V1754_06000 [Pseudomonadota bacterium]
MQSFNKVMNGTVVTILSITCFSVGCSNSSPQLQPLSPQTAYVGTEFRLEVMAYDADGDRLQFAYSIPTLDPRVSDAKIISMNGGYGIFTWTPEFSEVGIHSADFSVTDGKDTDIESIMITVAKSTDPNTSPRFIKPTGEGTILDLSKGPCLPPIPVQVNDSDSSVVEVTQQDPIEGSYLYTLGSMQWVLASSENQESGWCPNEQQRQQGSFIVHLVADDKENPPVHKHYKILITGTLPNTDGGPEAGPVEAGTKEAGQPGVCTKIQSWSGITSVAGYEDYVITYAYSRDSSSVPFRTLLIEDWHIPPDAYPKNVTFDSSTNLNTCDICIQLFENCTSEPFLGCPIDFFFVQAGTATVTRADKVESGGQIDATLSNLKLVEWDWQKNQPKLGGACYEIDSASFNLSW